MQAVFGSISFMERKLQQSFENITGIQADRERICASKRQRLFAASRRCQKRTGRFRVCQGLWRIGQGR